MIPNATSPRVDFSVTAQWANAHAVTLAAKYGAKIGRDGRAPCPIHGGKGRNLKITNGEGWFCHSGCATGGDMVDFIRRLKFDALPEKEGRVAALREIAGIMGGAAIQYTPPTQKTVAKAKPVDELETLRADGLVPSLPATIYRALVDHHLELGARGARYLASRGLDADAARAYGFRSIESPKAWNGLREFLNDSYLLAEQRNAGLSFFPWRGQVPALVIPYRLREYVLGLRYRNLKGDATHSERYRDLSGRSQRFPFNADALEVRGDLWIVEGELNAYTLSMYGVRTIGIPGAGRFRNEWLQLIIEAIQGKEFTVAWWDGDKAGQTGLEKFSKWFPRSTGARKVTADRDANELHLSGELRELIPKAGAAR